MDGAGKHLMALSLPAPLLDQYSEEELLLTIASIIRPGFLHRRPSENGLRMSSPGDASDPEHVKLATDEFQVLLGVLRAWRPGAGHRQDEFRPGIGPGAISDGHGCRRTTGAVTAHQSSWFTDAAAAHQRYVGRTQMGNVLSNLATAPRDCQLGVCRGPGT